MVLFVQQRRSGRTSKLMARSATNNDNDKSDCSRLLLRVLLVILPIFCINARVAWNLSITVNDGVVATKKKKKPLNNRYDNLLLQSGVQLVENEKGIPYWANLSVDRTEARVCVQVGIGYKVVGNGPETNATVGNETGSLGLGNPSTTTMTAPPEIDCPLPSFVVRLSGAAMVIVPLDGSTRDNRTTDDKSNDDNDDHYYYYYARNHGCTNLPVPGKYFAEVNLLSCHGHDNSETDMTHVRQNKVRRIYMQNCLLKPSIDPNSTSVPAKPPLTFQQPPFERTVSTSTTMTSYWIFAPPCPVDNNTSTAMTTDEKKQMALLLHKRNESCRVSREPRYYPTRYQIQQLLQQEGLDDFENTLHRFDDYLWLPVHHSNGTIVLDETTYTTPEYAPQLPALAATTVLPDHTKQHNSIETERFCFVGDSHARYLFFESMWISLNGTLALDPCSHRIYAGAKLHPHFRYALVRFADNLLSLPHVVKNKTDDESTTTTAIPLDKLTLWDHLEGCTRIVLSYGHWEAGWPKYKVTTPKEYAVLTAGRIE